MTELPSNPGRRRLRWYWIVLAAVLLLAVGFRVALPYVAQWGVGYGARRFAGLSARVQNVDVSLLRGRVTVDGLVVGEPGDATPPADLDPETAMVHVGRAYVDLAWLELLDRRIRLTELSIDSPQIRMEEEDGILVLPQRPPRDSGEEEAEPDAEEESKPWGVRVDRLALRDVGLQLVKRVDDTHRLDLGLAYLGLRDVAFEEGAFSTADLQLQSPVIQANRRLIFEPPRLPRSEDADQKSAAQESGGPPDYRLAKVDIDRAELTLRTAQGPLDIAIGLHASDINAQPGERFDIALDVEVEEGSVRWEGAVGLSPVAWEGQLVWSDMPVPPFTLINMPQVIPWLQSCRSSGELEISGSLGSEDGSEAAVVRTSGRGRVDQLAFVDPENGDVVVEISELEVVVREAVRSLAPSANGAPPTQMDIESIRVVDPKIRYTRQAPALDALLASLGGEPVQAEEAKSAAAPDAPPPIDLQLGSLELVGGELEYVDREVEPTFETSVRDLEVALSDVRFPAMEARSLEAKGLVHESSPFSLTASVQGGSGEGEFHLEALELALFNSYSEPAGYHLKQGTVSVDTKFEMEGSRTEVGNDLHLHKLALDSNDGGAFTRSFGMPLDLALALLRNPSGDISLPIPVAFDEQSLEIGIESIIAGALREALIGAASSPLKMAGAALRFVQGEDAAISLDPVAAVPGGVELVEADADRLKGLADLLSNRPSLGLVLEGRVGREDRPGVAEQMLAELVAADGDLPDVSAGFLERRRVGGYLEAKAKGDDKELDPKDQAVLVRYVDAVDVPPERMNQLALDRASRVRDRLVEEHGVDAARLQTARAEDGSPGVVLQFSAN